MVTAVHMMEGAAMSTGQPVDAGAPCSEANDTQTTANGDVTITVANPCGVTAAAARHDHDPRQTEPPPGDPTIRGSDREDDGPPSVGATSQAKGRDDTREGHDSQGGTRTDAAQPRRRGKTIRKAKGGKSVKEFAPRFNRDDI